MDEWNTTEACHLVRMAPILVKRCPSVEGPIASDKCCGKTLSRDAVPKSLGNSQQQGAPDIKARNRKVSSLAALDILFGPLIPISVGLVEALELSAVCTLTESLTTNFHDWKAWHRKGLHVKENSSQVAGIK